MSSHVKWKKRCKSIQDNGTSLRAYALAWNSGRETFQAIGIAPVMIPEGKIFLFVLQIGIFYRSMS
jgi:hypothetical protein